MNMKRYYAQLVGCKIVNFGFEQDERGLWGSRPFPVFTLERDDGTKITATISQDEEGNGGGFIFLEGAE